jgi:cytochrome P450 / NADPH-cytochrome P450 reductase
MFDRMLDVAGQLVLKWERFGPTAAFDVADSMTRLTLDTIALCAFDYRFNSFYQNEMHPVVAAMLAVLEEAGKRARRPEILSRLMWRRNRRYGTNFRLVYDLADRLIAERRRDPALGRRGDLLDVMLTAADHKTGEMLGDDNIRSQLMTFLVAGHETTSGLLSFAIWLLLNHPEALARARAQVDAVLGAQTPTVGRIAQLKYVERVLTETLRLWPTAPDFAVHPLAETVVGGRYRVTPDDILFVLLPILHRAPRVGRARGVPPRALRTGQRGKAAAQRLEAIRPRPALVHRPRLRAAGSHAGAGNDPPAVRSHLRRSGLSSQSEATPR